MTVQRIEVGLDWLACTFPAETTEDAGFWRSATLFAEELADRGETVRDGTLLGYRGMYVGKLFFGQREDGTFIRATGPLAMECFERMYVESMHVSRMDLQVTAWFSPNDEKVGKMSQRLATLYNESLSAARRRKITSYENNEGGYTLYIGSRTSDHYCRLYNKFAESKEEIYRGAWRYEVELHNQSATRCAVALNLQYEHMKSSILATVREYYQERGVYLTWAHAAEGPLSWAVDRGMSDDETSLRWLSTQVRPTVARLIKKGYTADVLAALDLAQLFYVAVPDGTQEAS